ncbi:MAG: hypothetical protein U0667_15180 [Chloroflexota bacterium]
MARELGAIGWGPDTWAQTPDGNGYYDLLMPLADPRPEDDMVDATFDIRVGDERYLVARHAEAGLDAFRAGTTVVFSSGQDAVTGTTASLSRIDYDEFGRPSRTDLGVVPVVVRPAAEEWSSAIMPTAVAASLGLELDPAQQQFLVRLDHDVTPADVERAAAVAVAADPNAYVSSPLPPPDPTLAFRVLLLGAAILAALTVTGIAVALGETEARPDQRTLLALGAARGLRRRITASRALVVAALAGVLAVPAGLLPVWGVLTSLDWPIVVPIPEVLGALVVLPLAAVAGGLLLGRPLPEWAARRDPGA